jgi:hypothetical protein
MYGATWQSTLSSLTFPSKKGYFKTFLRYTPRWQFVVPMVSFCWRCSLAVLQKFRHRHLNIQNLFFEPKEEKRIQQQQQDRKQRRGLPLSSNLLLNRIWCILYSHCKNVRVIVRETSLCSCRRSKDRWQAQNFSLSRWEKDEGRQLVPQRQTRAFVSPSRAVRKSRNNLSLSAATGSSTEYEQQTMLHPCDITAGRCRPI